MQNNSQLSELVLSYINTFVQPIKNLQEKTSKDYSSNAFDSRIDFVNYLLSVTMLCPNQIKDDIELQDQLIQCIEYLHNDYDETFLCDKHSYPMDKSEIKRDKIDFDDEFIGHLVRFNKITEGRLDSILPQI